MPIIPITITPISDVVTDGTTIQNIQGVNLITSYYDLDTYYLLVEDETGIIYVEVNLDLYRSNQAYYHYYMDDLLTISGTVAEVNGKRIMMASSITLDQTSIVNDSVFTPITISEFVALNTIPVGQAYEITGRTYFVYGNNGREYYLTDGMNTLRLFASDSNYMQLAAYSDLNVTIKAYDFGIDENGERVLMYRDYYNGVLAIQISDYTDAEAVELIKQSILNSYGQSKTVYMANDYVSLPNPNYTLVNAFNPLIETEIISGIEYLDDQGYAYFALQAPEDVEILIKTTITVNNTSISFYYSIYINGFTTTTLDTLFDMTPGTFEIALEATVIYTNFNFHYFLIDGQIYSLNAISYGGFSEGSKVILVGQKTIIDGIANYTYQVSMVSTDGFEELNIVSVPNTIETLYTNDYSLNRLQSQSQSIYGYVEYDPYLNMYTLTDNGYTVYIRMISNNWEMYDYLETFLGEYISLEVLLPMQYVRRDYMIVDSYKGYDGVKLDDYTKEESVTLIKNRLLDLGVIDLYSGEVLSDYLKNEYINHPYTVIEYSLVDPLDETYFDSSLLIFNAVSTIQTIDFLATIT